RNKLFRPSGACGETTTRPWGVATGFHISPLRGFHRLTLLTSNFRPAVFQHRGHCESSCGMLGKRARESSSQNRGERERRSGGEEPEARKESVRVFKDVAERAQTQLV